MVSPVEAIRYTEGNGRKQTLRKTRGKASLSVMAFANLGRNRSRTAVTIASMSLSVVLLCVTFTFTNGFDLDKYLADKALVDYIIADASYFQSNSSNEVISEEAVQYIKSNCGTENGGCTYRTTSAVFEYVSEKQYRKQKSKWSDEEAVDRMVERAERKDELLQNDVMLYGMEQFCLDKLNVIEGDIIV